jgi:glycosyltransferase involved in cell wall biosynthesis
VEVLSEWINPILKARDQALLEKLKFRYTPVLDATRNRLSWMKSRLSVKAAKLWHQRTGIESHWQIGYSVGALARTARQRKADLFIAHLEPGLWAGSQLSTLNSQLGLDLEDWYSEDLPPETRRQRPVRLLKRLERGALNRAAHSTCTSHAMSAALVAEYGCRPPVVIYNAFPWAERQSLDGMFKDRQDRTLPSLHWYSQTIGTDRGLGDLFAALPFMKHKFEIHLRGESSAGFEAWLAANVPEPWRKRVFIHPSVSNEELLSRIAEHDIGFAGEQKNVSRNRDLTVTNKILHYLLGGLAVVASDTAGQREIAEQANGAVRIYRSDDAASLANELNVLLTSPETLCAAKAVALTVAENNFCWERQVPALLNSVKSALVSAP